MKILFVVCFATLFTMICVADSAMSQGFIMTPLKDNAGVEPLIIGGRKSKVADWPATFAFSNCTSTAIGPRILLTAAHCVGNGAKGSLKAGGKDIQVECAHHSDYTPSTSSAGTKTTSADWALCIAKNDDIPVATFETINLNSTLLQTDLEILLTGFGCKKKDGVDDNYGVQYEGEAEIRPVTNATQPDGLPKATNDQWARHYATTVGGAAICYGDSGGAAYVYRDPAKKSRRVMAVNSRGDIKKVSYLSATSTGAFETWTKDWAKAWSERLKIPSLEICGIDVSTANCQP